MIQACPEATAAVAAVPAMNMLLTIALHHEKRSVRSVRSLVTTSALVLGGFEDGEPENLYDDASPKFARH
jgi:hypothetical protein